MFVFNWELHRWTIYRAAWSPKSIWTWHRAHSELLGICIALAPLSLPPYVLFEIIDWLMIFGHHTEKRKIDLIVAVLHGSVRRITAARHAAATHRRSRDQ